MEAINKYAPLVALKSQAIQYAEKIKDLKIVDDNSEAIVNQRLSEAKELLKAIEEKRVELKAPYLAAGKEIDAIAKHLIEDLDKAYSGVREDLKNYKELKERQRLLELEKLKAIQAKIDNLKTLALAEISKADKKQDLSAIFVKYVKDFPKDLLEGQFKEDAEAALNEIKKAGSTRLAEIVNPQPKESPVTEIAPVTTQPVVKEEPKLSKIEIAIAETEAQKTKGLRKNWTFELNDILKVPTTWLTLDEKKVKEWMKLAIENGNLKDGDTVVINGVKFYQSTTVVVN